MSGARLLDPRSTAAIVFGAHDWTEAGLERAPSFRRSARRVVQYLYDPAGLALDPELVLDLFDDPTSGPDQLARAGDTIELMIRDRQDEGRPITDVLVYYIGHGHPDETGGLSFLVRRTKKNLETETGIRASDLARTLRRAAPKQRRAVILDCCYSETAAKAFIGMSADLNVQTATAVAHEFESSSPKRGSILLASSAVGRASIGVPSADETLFTGALLKVLRRSVEGQSGYLSFFDLKEAVYDEMLSSFGSKAPRPALHQTNQEFGDLTRMPAFVLPAAARLDTPVKQERQPEARRAADLAPVQEPQAEARRPPKARVLRPTQSRRARTAVGDDQPDKGSRRSSLKLEAQSELATEPEAENLAGPDETARKRRLVAVANLPSVGFPETQADWIQPSPPAERRHAEDPGATAGMQSTSPRTQGGAGRTITMEESTELGRETGTSRATGVDRGIVGRLRSGGVLIIFTAVFAVVFVPVAFHFDTSLGVIVTAVLALALYEAFYSTSQ